MTGTTPIFDPSMGGCTSRHVMAGGLRTHCVETGSGPPVVLVHGGGPGADGYGNWHSCLPLLARNFHVLAVDMVGFGRTDKPDPATFVYSQDARVAHLGAFVEALGLGPVTLIGNSMGGLTSLGVSLQRPELVHRLILMGPAGIRAAIPPQLVPLLDYDGTRAGMTRVIRALTNADYVMDEPLLDYRVQLSNDPAGRAAHAAAMAWIKERRGLYLEEDEIRRVRTPTLVVGGKQDPIVTPAHIFRLLELIENSRGYLLPYCGHWVMMEAPQEFCDVCTQFIRR